MNRNTSTSKAVSITTATADASRRRWMTLLLGGTLAGALLWQNASHAGGSEEYVAVPTPTQDIAATPGQMQKAVFAGGCFWGVQGVFQHVQGVTRAVSGYAGGKAGTANYETVSGGSTGHAESVEVTFDPSKVTYGKLLQIYFSVAHNPTELNRQGPDSGTQYRSALFPVDTQQAMVAKAYIAQLDAAHVFPSPIVTKIEPGASFYAAEGYHQDFLTEHPNHGYIVVNDLPKVASLEKHYPAQYSKKPVLVKAGA